MGTILLRYKEKFRLLNLSIDDWETPLIDRDSMINYLSIFDDDWSKPCTRKEAIRRVDRVDFTHRHKLWLNRFFDSKYIRIRRSITNKRWRSAQADTRIASEGGE